MFCSCLAKWIVCNDQPFTTVENEHFRNMIEILNPEAQVPSADTIKNNIMKRFNTEQTRMKEEFLVS
jgi:hypothetical protein